MEQESYSSSWFSGTVLVSSATEIRRWEVWEEPEFTLTTSLDLVWSGFLLLRFPRDSGCQLSVPADDWKSLWCAAPKLPAWDEISTGLFWILSQNSSAKPAILAPGVGHMCALWYSARRGMSLGNGSANEASAVKNTHAHVQSRCQLDGDLAPDSKNTHLTDFTHTLH